MKKTTSETLIHKLISGKISREEFEELLLAVDDEEQQAALEAGLREHFDAIIDQHEQEAKKKSAESNLKSGS